MCIMDPDDPHDRYGTSVAARQASLRASVEELHRVALGTYKDGYRDGYRNGLLMCLVYVFFVATLALIAVRVAGR